MLVTMINGGGSRRPEAERLRGGLGRAQVDVEFVTPMQAPPKPGWYAQMFRYHARIMIPRAVDDRYHRFTADYTDDRRQLIRGLRQHLMGDVVHLFDADGFLDWLTTIPLLMKHVPIVWTVTDMNPFTGGCHTDAGCGRFVDRCGCCPALGSHFAGDESHHVIERKLQAMSGRNETGLAVVAPTAWLAAKSKSSRVFGRFDHRVIGPAVDTDVMRPGDRAAARARLGVPAETPVVLLAGETRSQLRGFQGYPERVPGVRFFSIGAGKVDFSEVINLDHRRTDAETAQLFAAADLTIIDAGPSASISIAVQSQSCGVPVVCYDSFGLDEIVADGITGVVIRQYPVHLGTIVPLLLRAGIQLQSMATAARERAVAMFDLKDQAQKYRDLYKEMAGRPAGGK